MEEFNLDLSLDEAAAARIAHAEYLEKMKDWGIEAGAICQPFMLIAEKIVEDNYELDEDSIKAIIVSLPFGVNLLAQHLNDFYDIMQGEAIKILGAPLQLHENHHPRCGEGGRTCGHHSHWETPNTDDN